MFYFAYGSNMDHDQMLRRRCPGAKFVSAAKLRDYCLVFDGYSPAQRGAVANIEPSTDDVLYGGLFEITTDHLAALDGFEGYPKSYSRKQFTIERLATHEKVQAWVYFRDSQAPGLPSHEYLAAVIQGARDCRLPDDYIAEALESLPHAPEK